MPEHTPETGKGPYKKGNLEDDGSGSCQDGGQGLIIVIMFDTQDKLMTIHKDS